MFLTYSIWSAFNVTFYIRIVSLTTCTTLFVSYLINKVFKFNTFYARMVLQIEISWWDNISHDLPSIDTLLRNSSYIFLFLNVLPYKKTLKEPLEDTWRTSGNIISCPLISLYRTRIRNTALRTKPGDFPQTLCWRRTINIQIKAKFGLPSPLFLVLPFSALSLSNTQIKHTETH